MYRNLHTAHWTIVHLSPFVLEFLSLWCLVSVLSCIKRARIDWNNFVFGIIHLAYWNFKVKMLFQVGIFFLILGLCYFFFLRKFLSKRKRLHEYGDKIYGPDALPIIGNAHKFPASSDGTVWNKFLKNAFKAFPAYRKNHHPWCSGKRLALHSNGPVRANFFPLTTFFWNCQKNFCPSRQDRTIDHLSLMWDCHFTIGHVFISWMEMICILQYFRFPTICCKKCSRSCGLWRVSYETMDRRDFIRFSLKWRGRQGFQKMYKIY